MEKHEHAIIIDAENAVLGRLASYAAKQAILGNKVIIVNSEKAIIVGNKNEIVARYAHKRSRGGSGLAGPLFPSLPDRILKRTIRNMLPYQKPMGRAAFKRVITYTGMPEEYKDKKMIKSGKGQKGITLNYLSEMLRGSSRWN